MKEMYGGKFNNKIGHAIPVWQIASIEKPDVIYCWGYQRGGMFDIIKQFYDKYIDVEIVELSEEEYKARGYAEKEIGGFRYFAEKGHPFTKADIPEGRIIGVPYVTTSFRSAAPKRTLHNYIPEIPSGYLRVDLDAFPCSMEILHMLIAGADRHIGIDSGPCWIAASVHTPITMISFEQNGWQPGYAINKNCLLETPDSCLIEIEVKNGQYAIN